MRNKRTYMLGMLCISVFLLAQGCISPDEILDGASCVDLPAVELGDCDDVVGYGRIGGACTEVQGCTAGSLLLFASLAECSLSCDGSDARVTCTQILDGLTSDIKSGKACLVDGHCKLVSDFGDCQIAVNNSITQEALDELKEGYEAQGCYSWQCEMTVGDPAAVCVDSQCAIEWTSRDNPPATCDNLYEVEFGDCDGLLGWGVVNGACELFNGCHTYDYGFYNTEAECATACAASITEQELCEATQGIWDANSCGHYSCGNAPSCTDTIPGCNCGPVKDFSSTEGCVANSACEEPSCVDLLGTDWGTCPAMPLGAGVVDGDCITVFGCEVPPGVYLYGSVTECEVACVGCHVNEDCSEGFYCLFPPESDCGFAGNGSCAPVNEICAQIYEPVCDCNGITRYSVCGAAVDGTYEPATVAYTGECMKEICLASGVEWDTDACGHYTCGDAPPGCGDPRGGCNCGLYGVWDDTVGQCSIDTVTCGPKPTCGDVSGVDFDVCSDTDTDPDNDSSHPLGAAVLDGSCVTIFGCEVPPGYVLFATQDDCIIECQGCQDNTDCPTDYYCDFPLESQCGAAGDGKCTRETEICAQIWDPVCDCNDKTRSSWCHAARGTADDSATSVQYEGICLWEQEQKCGTSGGTWDANACGNYVCGVVPDSCAEPTGGCDCGAGRNYSESVNRCDDDPVGCS